MTRWTTALAFVISACASREPLEEPTIHTVPASLIADFGASFYVLEGWEDWLDDASGIDVRIPPSGAVEIGEQDLGLVLRFALSQKKVTLVGHADFQPPSGCPTEVTLFKPDAEMAGGGKAPRRVGFRIRLNASPGPDPRFIAIEWEALKLTDSPEENPAPRGSPRAAESIAKASGTMPLGAALLLRHSRGDRRAYFLILRIASLKEP